MFQQFIRFCGVGLIATALQYIILIVLSEAAQVNAVAASAVGYGLSAAVNYSLNYYFTFASRQSHRVAATRFAVVSTVGLGLNTSLMYVGVSVLRLHYLPVQIVATIVVLAWNFSANRIWTYRLPDQIPSHDEL